MPGLRRSSYLLCCCGVLEPDDDVSVPPSMGQSRRWFQVPSVRQSRRSPMSMVSSPNVNRRALRRKLRDLLAAQDYQQIQNEIQADTSLTRAERTQAAIQAELVRVQQLSPSERATLGSDFTEADAVWQALSENDGQATVLLRASWLRTRKGERLPKRGDPLPPNALIGVAELRCIYEAAHGRVGKKHTALPLIVVSHFWRSKAHPDPDGCTLATLIATLDERWRDFEVCGVTDLGIFIE